MKGSGNTQSPCASTCQNSIDRNHLLQERISYLVSLLGRWHEKMCVCWSYKAMASSLLFHLIYSCSMCPFFSPNTDAHSATLLPSSLGLSFNAPFLTAVWWCWYNCSCSADLPNLRLQIVPRDRKGISLGRLQDRVRHAQTPRLQDLRGRDDCLMCV